MFLLSVLKQTTLSDLAQRLSMYEGAKESDESENSHISSPQTQRNRAVKSPKKGEWMGGSGLALGLDWFGGDKILEVCADFELFCGRQTRGIRWIGRKILDLALRRRPLLRRVRVVAVKEVGDHPHHAGLAPRWLRGWGTMGKWGHTTRGKGKWGDLAGQIFMEKNKRCGGYYVFFPATEEN